MRSPFPGRSRSLLRPARERYCSGADRAVKEAVSVSTHRSRDPDEFLEGRARRYGEFPPTYRGFSEWYPAGFHLYRGSAVGQSDP